MRILIIDDSSSDHEMCVGCLESEGDDFQFFHAYTAQQGLVLYANQEIDCVLLDYHLPDMDGLEVLKKLAMERKPVPVPVIMMTADGNEMLAVRSIQFGSQDYIPKKVITASALKRAVERATDRVEMLHKMEQYRADLERSNYDLEQFSTIVAHDLKSPLRAITQHLTLLKNKHGVQMEERSLRSLNFAVEGADRMRALIDALFTYARLGFAAPTMRRVPLQVLLTASIRDLAAEINDSGAVITHGALPEVVGDAVLLCQLLQNLLANAIKYCSTKPRIHVSAEMDGTQWKIHVKDNGIGVPSSQHEKIFAIFRRLHQEEEYPGIGLGLAVCQRIAQQHGGTISIVSESEQGSTFTLSLPVIESMASPCRLSYAS